MVVKLVEIATVEPVMPSQGLVIPYDQTITMYFS